MKVSHLSCVMALMLPAWVDCRVLPKPERELQASGMLEKLAFWRRSTGSQGAKDVFLIHAAPTVRTVQMLTEDISTKPSLKVLVAAALWSQPSEGDVYTLPSNARAPYALSPFLQKEVKEQPGILHLQTQPPCKSHGKWGNDEIDDPDSWKKVQLDVSTAWQQIFDMTTRSGIPVYFTLLPRSSRPFAFSVSEKEGKKSLGMLYKGNPVLPKGPRPAGGARSILSIARLLLHSFGSRAKVIDDITNYTSRKATYFADVLSVAAGGLLDDQTVWDRFHLKEAAVMQDGKFTKPIMGQASTAQDFAWCKLETEPNPKGEVYVLKSDEETVDKLLESLSFMYDTPEATKTQQGKMWDSCTIWHDTELNDVDDMPANYLAGMNTKEGHLGKEKSWDINFNWEKADWAKSPESAQKWMKSLKQNANKPDTLSDKALSHFKNFIGIFSPPGEGGYREGRYAELLPNADRPNAKDEYQPQSDGNLEPKLIVSRNKGGAGGSPDAVSGQPGSAGELESVWWEESTAGSMSQRHEFTILDDAYFWTSNAFFFGKDPARRTRIEEDAVCNVEEEGAAYKRETVTLLNRLKEFGRKWKELNSVTNAYFGFHEAPDHSFHSSAHAHDRSRCDNRSEDQQSPSRLQTALCKDNTFEFLYREA
uniref:Uncharacterized protein n=1 Tax=Chromera velia CCMP2878 TaxID=1169474 RepID=A0A0G4FG35_9ALVE|eukprot:Cvel_16736.t1-p1 / transcript=Cvel_16736.t1 / gene=Cvel_16736 / organism=Chromera_velia_CCMP2878 / gene_product=hypothetical protein / transcript_product=hypothetical protein / location=Cvel_scaffold1302:17234-19177(-) / protein_length=648 / sequence_SO=supercontig / SO=protein_coding / is_pseudo=false